MYKPKLEKDIRCPLEYGLEIFGGKWKSRIICVLSKKKILRYSELKKELVNITDKDYLLCLYYKIFANGLVYIMIIKIKMNYHNAKNVIIKDRRK